MPFADMDYYNARAAEERALAAAATSESVAAVHRDLADKYEARAKQPDDQPMLHTGWGGMTGA